MREILNEIFRELQGEFRRRQVGTCFGSWRPLHLPPAQIPLTQHALSSPTFTYLLTHVTTYLLAYLCESQQVQGKESLVSQRSAQLRASPLAKHFTLTQTYHPLLEPSITIRQGFSFAYSSSTDTTFSPPYQTLRGFYQTIMQELSFIVYNCTWSAQFSTFQDHI